MAQDAMNQLQADKNLEADIMKCKTPEEIQQLLANAVERSNLGLTRDLTTGRFVRTEQAIAAVVQAAAAAPREFKKTEVIAGTSLEFVASSEAELTRQILDANRIAATLADANRSERTSRDAQQEVMDKVDAERELRLGTITTAEYLERTNAIENYLASQGVDVGKISSEQYAQSWAKASEEFKRTTGADWPGGQKNLLLIGDKIAALGLTNATDKVAALTQAYEALKATGTLFDADVSQAEVEAMTANATPAEILQAWKERQNIQGGDATEANQEFIRTFQNGRSSGLFGR